MKKLLFSLILSLLPIASSAIQYEYFNPLMKSNAAVKVNETVGVLTPPEGKGFGILSALTNLQSVNSSITTDEYGIQVDTLGLVCPTEEAVAAAISDHNSSETAHSFIQNKVAVNTAAIDANADAIQKTRDDMNEEDGRLQTQITAHAGAITALQNEQTATGNQIQTIESKIPDGTSDTNPLINKQQLLDEEMDIREDLNESVSELQTQITAQAAAIAGKQDELIAGDNITIVDNVISATGGGGGSGDYLPLSGGTMSGDIAFSTHAAIGADYLNGLIIKRYILGSWRDLYHFKSGTFTPADDGNKNLGASGEKWRTLYVGHINNGADLIVPTEGGTIARLEDLEGIGGASLPILTAMWSDHLLNDISWLRANTFSWQSGNVYVAAYNHLVDDAFSATINGEKYYRWYVSILSGITYYTKSFTPNQGDIVYEKSGTGEMVATEYTVASVAGNELTLSNGSIVSADINFVFTDTIGDITITYYQAEDGHKICLPDQESNIVSLYNNTGSANYYILDTTNKQFKLPRKQKRTLVRTVKNDNYTWYNLYSDGWVEQGGFLPDTWSGSKTFTFPVAMADSNYTLTTSSGTPDIGGMHGKDYVTARSATSFTYSSSSVSGNFTTKNFSWLVEGYASASAYADVGVRLEYYFVGNFEQSAIEQTAGLNAEMFNDLNAHRVIEFQAPTAANGYTWYRKYADGWVEQGGIIPVNTSSITLPVEMADADYMFQVSGYKRSDTATMTWAYVSSNTQTTTGFTIASSSGGSRCWEVKGMSAQ